MTSITRNHLLLISILLVAKAYISTPLAKEVDGRKQELILHYVQEYYDESKLPNKFINELLAGFYFSDEKGDNRTFYPQPVVTTALEITPEVVNMNDEEQKKQSALTALLVYNYFFQSYIFIN